MHHISGLWLPPMLGTPRPRGKSVKDFIITPSKRKVCSCHVAMCCEEIMQEPFIFIRGKTGPSSAVLSLGSTRRKFSWPPYFPALTDKTHSELQTANLRQTGILIFVSLPACLRQSKANFHIKHLNMKCSSHCQVTGMHLTVYTWNYSLALFQLYPENTPHPDSVPIPCHHWLQS